MAHDNALLLIGPKAFIVQLGSHAYGTVPVKASLRSE